MPKKYILELLKSVNFYDWKEIKDINFIYNAKKIRLTKEFVDEKPKNIRRALYEILNQTDFTKETLCDKLRNNILPENDTGVSFSHWYIIGCPKVLILI